MGQRYHLREVKLGKPFGVCVEVFIGKRLGYLYYSINILLCVEVTALMEAKYVCLLAVSRLKLGLHLLHEVRGLTCYQIRGPFLSAALIHPLRLHGITSSARSTTATCNASRQVEHRYPARG